jgi:molybdopterin-guanine dinucleotide biosynthesis protein A
MPTLVEASLLRQAHEYWDNGEYIPLDLFAALASEGLDVPALEARFIQN